MVKEGVVPLHPFTQVQTETKLKVPDGAAILIVYVGMNEGGHCLGFKLFTIKNFHYE